MWTAASQKRHVIGDMVFIACELTPDASYATGGDALDQTAFDGLTDIISVMLGSPNAAKYRAVWDGGTEKIQVFLENGTSGIEAEVSAATDLSAVFTVEAWIVGY